ncbi:hypothetical protein [Convivina praedatoris]|uniref:DUF2798 domain-containing protein n=1 Tax=Convivina praedatoris TaxID=2880963 RepID=A0ABM9D218_9LACO|nr:hypothetical protein [Convivina sp. LMG 32447]CAH1852381.1 hypothetical protein R077815_00557 [Convivina sp. LMG 32447]CAH1853552.1 hypothetical protein R078138_00673 [Convivina sp. LMG 32447]CAH1854510.1 hypothetical protein LMG032447_00889 [Convivina sp. LMG 32447]
MKKSTLFFRRILHHPNTLSWLLITTMVAIMVSYNSIIRYGFSEKIFFKILIIYPFAVVLVYALRTYFTLPLAIQLHKYFPNNFQKYMPPKITVPLLVITFNVTVMMAIFTELNYKLYPHFISGYIGNWEKTFIVVIPVFFFIVRPIITAVLYKLKVKYPLPVVDIRLDSLERTDQ